MPCSRMIADLLPELHEEGVGELIVVESVEAGALDELVHEQHRLVAHAGHGAYARRADARIAGEERHERLVLDAAAQAEERPLVADVLQSYVAVGAEQQVGGALLRTLHLRVEAGAVGLGDEVRGARAGRGSGRGPEFWGAADLIAEGDYVVGRWAGGGTHTGPAFGDFLMGSLPANTGRKMHFTGTTVLRLRNGKIIEEVGLDDGVAALQQLGLIRAA